MQTTHSRYQHNLSWAQASLIGLIFILLAPCFQAEAQWIDRRRSSSLYTKNASGGAFRNDERLRKPLHFGFFLAPLMSRYQVETTADFVNRSPTNAGDILTVNGTRTGGFALGFYASLKVSDFWDLRFHPTVAFYEHQINYTLNNGEESTQLIEAPMFEVPIMLKYRSQLRGTKGMYLIAGIKPAIALSAGKETVDVLQTTGTNLSVEYGFGFDVFFPFFKFAPELRFSHGLINVHQSDPENPFSIPLENVRAHSVTLYLHFGG